MSSTPANAKLFQALKVGSMLLQHRIVLAPLTRFRADAAHVHTDLGVEYYAQRASMSGTLLTSEATIISPDAGGYDHVPGIYNEAQIAAWKKVTDAVHAKGSFIICQLWAQGCTVNPDILSRDGFKQVGASDIPTQHWGSKGARPHALTEEEITEYVHNRPSSTTQGGHYSEPA